MILEGLTRYSISSLTAVPKERRQAVRLQPQKRLLTIALFAGNIGVSKFPHLWRSQKLPQNAVFVLSEDESAAISFCSGVKKFKVNFTQTYLQVITQTRMYRLCMEVQELLNLLILSMSFEGFASVIRDIR